VVRKYASIISLQVIQRYLSEAAKWRKRTYKILETQIISTNKACSPCQDGGNYSQI